ncbi:putative centrosomal protein [Crotalus adamanteus]|uniref:Centrosomal protein n=1 Tax=Crotalus adamanteus TaxID=8729 RepID=A0AAW1BNS5_CROAD
MVLSLSDLTTKEYISLEKENENQFASLDPDENEIASEIDTSAVASFSRFIENEKLLSFESLEECSADYDIGSEEFCDDQLKAYFEQLVLPEIEDAEEHGDYIKSMELPPEQEKFQIPTVYQATVRNHPPTANYEESYDAKGTHYSIQEGQFKLPTITRQEKNENCKSNPKSEYRKSSGKLSVGTAANLSEIKSIKTDSQHICSEIEDYHGHDSEDEIFKITTECRNNATNEINSELKLDSLYLKCIEDNAASEIWNTEQQIKFPNQCQIANENHISLADVYLSPTICKESEHDQHTTQEDQSHNVVYQNEEGKWVTDLAYYTSFDKEQKSNISDISGDFITGAEAIAMIAQDQEAFEKEHRFIQEEKMDLQNISGLEDTSWKLVNNHNILRESQNDFKRDASYLRLSLGEFFGQRSEALGCLGGSGDVKRPSFGYHITSPKKRRPVPLLRQSDICTTNSSEQNLNISSSCQGDVKESIKKEDAFATSAVGETSMQYRENRTNQLRDRELERKHLRLEPSVLKTKLPSMPTSSESEERANTNTLPFDLKVIPKLVPPIPNNEKATNKESNTCYNEKHVTFENIHVDNETIVDEAVARIDPKLMTSTPGVEISDEQYNFRPSTSPLTHSSPSESSGTTFTGSVFPSTSPNFKESTCNDNTLPRSVYSDPSLEHLTFVSATENTCKSLPLSSPPRYKSNRTIPDAGGLRQREESMTFGFERVKVPEEVKFPNSCCVGLTSHAVLNIFNPSERWLQVNIGLLSIMLDGEKVDPLKHRCLLFKSKTVIGPCAAEELKMLFLPCQAGVFQCVLNIASWPFSADPDIVLQAEALGSRVVVNAVAENPDIEVEAGTTNSLDFGDLPYGSWKVLPLKLTNKTCARLPIRLVIHANAVAWRCFTFSKEPVNSSLKSAIPSYNISQLAAPSVISHVMNASCDTQDPDLLVIWVQFRAPSKCTYSDSLGPADEYLARIDIEIDCPEPGNVLKSIPLSARSGTPRIYAPKGLQTLYMCTKIGSSTKQQLPLKNAGNIKVDLKIMSVESDNCISINPEDLILIPGEEQEVTIEFSPKDYKNSDSVVKIMVLPSGPEYKVIVKGDVSMEENKPLVQKCSNSEVPPILANKQLLIWGGVQIGRTMQQKLILRNDSSSTTQQLRLLIRGQDQDCFQLKVGEYVYNNCEIKIRPKHDYSICVTFTPYRLTCMFAKLEMKQLGVLSQLGIKFTIPLYGYGGKSNVRLEDVKKQANKYIVGLPDLAPEKFILKEGSKQKIAITYIPSEEIKNSSVLSTICLFYGDEILRQYCRTIQHKPEQLQKILSPDNPVVNIKFDEEFPGEELVEEVYDLPQQLNDLQYFLTNMRKITLSVINDSASTVSDSASTASSVHQMVLERPAIPEKSAMTLDVLPVKGPHGCALSSKNDGLNENILLSHETWTLQPEFLILTAPFQSGATVTKYTQITNNSNRSLKFELSWPAHCLTVTPQHGIIEPGSNISIHVSPNPSLADNKSIFPWSGLIYIHCDGGQKLVKVQIRENITEKSSEKSSLTAKMGAHQQQSELAVSHIQPCQKKQLTKLEVKNRTIFFPETKSGEHSEKYLEIENNGDENLKWFLTSFAPPYVKGADESGDVYRATYAAFQCSYLSGTLEICGKEKIIVSFLPRDKGHYSQFWDLECHPLHEPHLTDKYRLQFCGVSILSNKQLKNKILTSSLVKINIRDVTQRREYLSIFDHNIWRGVYAQEDVYTFSPTRVGESSTLKISMKNYSMSSCQLNFRSPGEPFYIKHSHYNLRCHHYCNLPVQFKPMSPGIFKCLLVVETDKSGTLTIQLIGEGLAENS